MAIMRFFNRKGKDKEKDAKEQTTKEPSIYSTICYAIQPDGSLPPDFCVRKKAENNKVTFADGAMDGIAIYHMGRGDADIQPLCDIVMLISAAKFSEAEVKLLEYFSASEYIAMLQLIDGLQEWIIQNRDDIDPNNLHGFALNTLKGSPHIECVKFALSVLELLDNGTNNETRTIVENLAASDEFTIFCLFIMRKWPDANQAIFETAKKVHGWGKVHAVEQLSVVTDEIKHWLLYEGCDNSILSEYSALTCANKVDLKGLLQNDTITSEDFAAAAALVASLLPEGPVAGISGIDDPENLLVDFLKHAERSTLSIREYETALSIQEYCERKDWPRKGDIIEICSRILASDACVQVVDESVHRGEGFRFAKRLGFDYSHMAYEQIVSDFEHSYQLVDILLPDGLFVDEIIALFEQRLPLAEMATGPSNEMGLGSVYTRYHILIYIVQHLKGLPGRGEDLLLCALNVPVINCRNMALNVLEAWRESGIVFSQNISNSLEILKHEEVNEDIRKRLTSF